MFLSHQSINRKPEPVSYTSHNGDFTLSHEASFRHSGDETSPLFILRASGPLKADRLNVSIQFRPVKSEAATRKNILIGFTEMQMKLGEDAIDDFEVPVTPYREGTELFYWFKVANKAGEVLATLPANAESEEDYLRFRFEGIIPIWLIALYVFVVGSTVVAATLTVLTAAGTKNGAESLILLLKQSVWTLVFLTAGGLLLSIVLRNRILGDMAWRGLPVAGADISDVFAGIAIAVWGALVALLIRKSLKSSDADRERGMNSVRALIMIGYALVLAFAVAPRCFLT